MITASAGNHGLGVAYAAAVFGVPATVYVPVNANPLKVDGMAGPRTLPALFPIGLATARSEKAFAAQVHQVEKNWAGLGSAGARARELVKQGNQEL